MKNILEILAGIIKGNIIIVKEVDKQIQIYKGYNVSKDKMISLLRVLGQAL